MADARLEVVIDGRQAATGARQVTVSMDRMVRGVANVNGAFDRMQRSIFSLRGALTALAGIRQLTQSIDAWGQYEARLRLVTDSAEELAFVQDRLFESAQETRSAFGEMVTLYSRVADATRALGLSQQQLIDVTTTVNQAIQIGGASAQQAESGVRQFAEALASGELGGDGFRSISENLIGLTDALVDGLNELGEFGDVTVGTLRAMSAEGTLTTDVLIRAIEAVQDQTKETFDELPRTIGQAIQQLENDMFRVIGTTDETTAIGERFAEAIDRVREVINSPDFVEAIASVVEALAFMAEHIDLVVAAGSALIGLRLGAAFGPIGAAVGVVAGGLVGLSTWLGTATSESDHAATAADRYASALEAVEEGLYDVARARVEESRVANQSRLETLGETLAEQVSEFNRVEGLILEGRSRNPGFDDTIGGEGLIATYERVGRQIEDTSLRIAQARGNLAIADRTVEEIESSLADVGNTAGGTRESLAVMASETTDAVGEFIRLGDEGARMAFEIQAVHDQARALIEPLNELRNEAFFAGDVERAQELAAQIQQVRDSTISQIETIEGRYTPAVDTATGATAVLVEELGRVKGKGEEVNDNLKETAETAEDFADRWQQFGSIASSALEDAILNGGEFRDVLAGILDDLARLAIQQASLAAFGGNGSGGGFFGDLLGAVLGGFGGGTGGGVGGVTQGIGTSHGGGSNPFPFTRSSMTGDETLRVVRRNEEVLTLGDRRHSANRADGGVTIHQSISVDAKAVNENGLDDPAAVEALRQQMRTMAQQVYQEQALRGQKVNGIHNRF